MPDAVKGASTGTPVPPERIGGSFKRNGTMIGIIVGILAVAVIWLLTTGDGQQTFQTHLSAEKKDAPVAQTAGGPEMKAPGLVVSPGETAHLVLTGYLPFLHADDINPAVEAFYKVLKNPWQDLGVVVEISTVSYDSENIDLWELGTQHEQYYLPRIAEADLYAKQDQRWFIANPGEANINELKRIWFSYTVEGYRKLGETTEKEFRATVSNQKYSYVRKSGYVGYRARIEFSFSVPTGSEFTDEGLGPYIGRSRDLTIATDGFSFETYGINASTQFPHNIYLKMTHASGRAGVALTEKGARGWVLMRD